MPFDRPKVGTIDNDTLRAMPVVLVDSSGEYAGSATGGVVSTRAVPLAGTDRSITATTTSQPLMAANATRSKFIIKNDTAIDVWITFGATAAATPGSGNIKIAAGAFFELTGSSSAIQIIAASTTAAITAREF